MGITEIFRGIKEAVVDGLGKASDDVARKVSGTGNKIVDELAEQLGKGKGNKVVDEAVYSMDDAVKKGNRAGKMKKADIEAKKAEIKARREARANGQEVTYEGNLGGVTGNLGGAQGRSGPYTVKYDGNTYKYNGKKWQQQKTVGSGDTAAGFYEDVDLKTSTRLNEKFLFEPPKRLNKNTNGLEEIIHSNRQKELESIWTPRTQEDLNKANRSWTQRTLDKFGDDVVNAFDHVSGSNARRTTKLRREYNQRVFETGQGDFISSNSEYKRMQRQYGKSKADTPETLHNNMLQAQINAGQAVGECDGIPDWVKFAGIGTAGAIAGAVIFGGDDDDE